MYCGLYRDWVDRVDGDRRPSVELEPLARGRSCDAFNRLAESWSNEIRKSLRRLRIFPLERGLAYEYVITTYHLSYHCYPCYT